MSEGKPESRSKDFWRERRDTVSCLILDLRLRGESGLDFQEELAREGVKIPIVFISAHGDIPVAVRTMKGGASEFLAKPFRDQALLDAVYSALESDRKRRDELKKSAQLKARYETLTEREREVLPRIISGDPNKQIAYEMSLSEVTVKVHRAAVFRKLGVRTLADLVKIALALDISASGATEPRVEPTCRTQKGIGRSARDTRGA